MFTPSRKNLFRFILKSVSTSFIFIITFSLVLSPVASQAQMITQTSLGLPIPGAMITPSTEYIPAIVRGLTIHPDNPLQFDFIVDAGDSGLALNSEAFQSESKKLVKYFLASLTVPEKDLWVNLSPYESDRITSEGLGATEMGRDLLAQDYMLKQLTASLVYPEDELGNEFWKKIRQKVNEKYGKVNIPLNTFNKVWIVPQKAVVYEHDDTVFVLERHLKVMLEEDYLALQKDINGTQMTQEQELSIEDKALSGITAEVVREILIPEIEKEVNEGETFANLRQIYNSMILAAWYKKSLKASLLGQVYFDQNKTKGVDLQDPSVNQKIYEQYLEAFKIGVYDYIKEDYDATTQAVIPQKYFSGGVTTNYNGQSLEQRVQTVSKGTDGAMLGVIKTFNNNNTVGAVSINLIEGTDNADLAMAINDRLESSDAAMLGKKAAAITLALALITNGATYSIAEPKESKFQWNLFLPTIINNNNPLNKASVIYANANKLPASTSYFGTATLLLNHNTKSITINTDSISKIIIFYETGNMVIDTGATTTEHTLKSSFYNDFLRTAMREIMRQWQASNMERTQVAQKLIEFMVNALIKRGAFYFTGASNLSSANSNPNDPGRVMDIFTLNGKLSIVQPNDGLGNWVLDTILGALYLGEQGFIPYNHDTFPNTIVNKLEEMRDRIILLNSQNNNSPSERANAKIAMTFLRSVLSEVSNISIPEAIGELPSSIDIINAYDSANQYATGINDKGDIYFGAQEGPYEGYTLIDPKTGDMLTKDNSTYKIGDPIYTRATGSIISNLMYNLRITTDEIKIQKLTKQIDFYKTVYEKSIDATSSSLNNISDSWTESNVNEKKSIEKQFGDQIISLNKLIAETASIIDKLTDELTDVLDNTSDEKIIKTVTEQREFFQKAYDKLIDTADQAMLGNNKIFNNVISFLIMAALGTATMKDFKIVTQDNKATPTIEFTTIAEDRFLPTNDGQKLYPGRSAFSTKPVSSTRSDTEIQASQPSQATQATSRQEERLITRNLPKPDIVSINNLLNKKVILKPVTNYFINRMNELENSSITLHPTENPINSINIPDTELDTGRAIPLKAYIVENELHIDHGTYPGITSKIDMETGDFYQQGKAPSHSDSPAYPRRIINLIAELTTAVENLIEKEDLSSKLGNTQAEIDNMISVIDYLHTLVDADGADYFLPEIENVPVGKIQFQYSPTQIGWIERTSKGQIKIGIAQNKLNGEPYQYSTEAPRLDAYSGVVYYGRGYLSTTDNLEYADGVASNLLFNMHLLLKGKTLQDLEETEKEGIDDPLAFIEAVENLLIIAQEKSLPVQRNEALETVQYDPTKAYLPEALDQDQEAFSVDISSETPADTAGMADNGNLFVNKDGVNYSLDPLEGRLLFNDQMIDPFSQPDEYFDNVKFLIDTLQNAINNRFSPYQLGDLTLLFKKAIYYMSNSKNPNEFGTFDKEKPIATDYFLPNAIGVAPYTAPIINKSDPENEYSTGINSEGELTYGTETGYYKGPITINPQNGLMIIESTNIDPWTDIETTHFQEFWPGDPVHIRFVNSFIIDIDKTLNEISPYDIETIMKLEFQKFLYQLILKKSIEAAQDTPSSPIENPILFNAPTNMISWSFEELLNYITDPKRVDTAHADIYNRAAFLLAAQKGTFDKAFYKLLAVDLLLHLTSTSAGAPEYAAGLKTLLETQPTSVSIELFNKTYSELGIFSVNKKALNQFAILPLMKERAEAGDEDALTFLRNALLAPVNVYGEHKEIIKILSNFTDTETKETFDTFISRSENSGLVELAQEALALVNQTATMSSWGMDQLLNYINDPFQPETFIQRASDLYAEKGNFDEHFEPLASLFDGPLEYYVDSLKILLAKGNIAQIKYVLFNPYFQQEHIRDIPVDVLADKAKGNNQAALSALMNAVRSPDINSDTKKDIIRSFVDINNARVLPVLLEVYNNNVDPDVRTVAGFAYEELRMIHGKSNNVFLPEATEIEPFSIPLLNQHETELKVTNAGADANGNLFVEVLDNSFILDPITGMQTENKNSNDPFKDSKFFAKNIEYQLKILNHTLSNTDHSSEANNAEYLTLVSTLIDLYNTAIRNIHESQEGNYLDDAIGMDAFTLELKNPFSNKTTLAGIDTDGNLFLKVIKSKITLNPITGEQDENGNINDPYLQSKFFFNNNKHILGILNNTLSNTDHSSEADNAKYLALVTDLINYYEQANTNITADTVKTVENITADVMTAAKKELGYNTEDPDVGGINLDAAMMNLQIKRDGRGVPLPVLQQPISTMQIDGFLPVIINVAPINIPLFLGLKEDGTADNDQLSRQSLDPMDKGEQIYL